MQTRTNTIISCAVGVAVLSIIALRGGNPNVAYEIGEEQIPSAETQHINHLVRQFQQQVVVQDDHPTPSPSTRNQLFGCVRAELAVVENLAAELSVGIFQPGARYPAWVRFSSNADPHAAGEPDLINMAIKLLGVAGQKLYPLDAPNHGSQDLLLVSQPAFTFPDVQTYAQAFEAFTANKSLQFYFNPFNPNVNLFFSARNTAPQPDSLLYTRWWSAVPYAYGENRAVKYSARPCKKSSQRETQQASDHQNQLKQQLGNGAGCFEFMLQFQVDAQKLPVEDPSIVWDEFLAPFEPVALLTIEAQRFDSAEQMKFCENLNYHPWRVRTEHRPLGGINRAYREVYSTLSDIRHRAAGRAATEPRELQVFGP